MLAVLFAVIAAVGAWLAWRHNPLYSTLSMLRTVLFAGLAIGAVIALLAATVSLTIDRSPAVAMSALGVVIVVSTLALIFIIQAVSTPKEARLATALPPAAKVEQIHRRRVYVWAQLFGAVLAAGAILALLIPGDTRYGAYALLAITMLLTLILLPTLYINARKLDRSLTALECNPWVHWRYPPEEWRPWAEAQVERRRATAVTSGAAGEWCGLAVAMLAIGGGVAVFAPGSWREKAAYLVALYAVFGAVAVLSARAGRRAPDRLRARLDRAAPEAYLGRDGLFCDGAYTPWLGLGEYLTSAALDTRPPRHLVFNFAKVVVSPYALYQPVPVQRCVLIPKGGEADVVRLQQELSARCPKASVALA